MSRSVAGVGVMAATRNIELAKAVTKVVAKELRASGVRWKRQTNGNDHCKKSQVIVKANMP